MNENIDLTKILKNCPKGWKFYSSVYGEVEFIEISINPIPPYMTREDEEWYLTHINEREYPIKLMTDSGEYCVSHTGRHRYGVGECTFFPSREQRDWSKFTAPWLKKERFDPKTLNAFDKVLIRDSDNESWCCDLFSHIKEENMDYKYVTSGFFHYRCCIPYNDETKHRVGTKDEAPDFYRYWED